MNSFNRKRGYLLDWSPGFTVTFRFAMLSALVFSFALDSQAQSKQLQKEAIQANSQGLALRDQGKLQEAEPILRRSQNLAERGFGPQHQNTGRISQNLGSLYYRQNKYQDAIRVCQQVVLTSEANHDYQTLATSCETLGLAYLKNKQYAKAADAFAKGLPYQKKYNSVLQDAKTRVNLGRALSASGNPAKAIPYLKDGFAVIEHDKAAIKYGQTAMAAYDLAVALGEINQYAESEMWFEKALNIREQVWGKGQCPQDLS